MECNLVVNSPKIAKSGGQPKFRYLKKWEFYSISSKEMITYVDNEENQNFERVQRETHIHTLKPVKRGQDVQYVLSYKGGTAAMSHGGVPGGP